jgi:tetratricopeptide (TPR) repeat protein
MLRASKKLLSRSIPIENLSAICKALELQLSAYQFSQSPLDLINLSRHLCALSQEYTNTKAFDKLLQSYQPYAFVSTLIQNNLEHFSWEASREIARHHDRLAQACSFYNKYEEAIAHYRMGIEVLHDATETNDIKNTAHRYFNIAKIYRLQGKSAEAAIAAKASISFSAPLVAALKQAEVAIPAPAIVVSAPPKPTVKFSFGKTPALQTTTAQLKSILKTRAVATAPSTPARRRQTNFSVLKENTFAFGAQPLSPNSPQAIRAATSLFTLSSVEKKRSVPEQTKVSAPKRRMKTRSAVADEECAKTLATLVR